MKLFRLITMIAIVIVFGVGCAPRSTEVVDFKLKDGTQCYVKYHTDHYKDKGCGDMTIYCNWK